MKFELKSLLVSVFVIALILVPLKASAQQLTAGDVDDNLNFDHYLRYINHTLNNSDGANPNSVIPVLDLKDRVTIRVIDSAGIGVSNAIVNIALNGSDSSLISSRTGTDGIFRFFPAQDGANGATRFKATISSSDGKSSSVGVMIDLKTLGASRMFTVTLPSYTSSLPDALDLVLVIDCTGSMSDELNYLRSEFGDMIGQIQAGNPNVSMRFALVVYRDEGDDFVVKHYEFTDSVSTMQAQLNQQAADGGGDYEEAVHKALKEGVALQWRGDNTLKLLFHVADAPPHNEYLQAALDQVTNARAKGVHIFPLAASGVADIAEYMMRAEASLTGGRYMFLTDDSGIGSSHAEPHIQCYVVSTLEDLFVRVVDSQLTGKRVEPTPNQTIRMVGNYSKGVCLSQEDVSTDPDTPPVASAGGTPVSSGTGTPVGLTDHDGFKYSDTGVPSSGGTSPPTTAYEPGTPTPKTSTTKGSALVPFTSAPMFIGALVIVVMVQILRRKLSKS
jgi:hypothetical protein